MKKQRKRKRSIFPKVIAILMILIVIGLLIWLGYVIVHGVDTVTKEADKIATLDMTEDTIDPRLYSVGSFAVVEETMKTYMNEYSVTLQEATNLLQDGTYSDMLLSANVQADGPAFTNSRAYIAEKRQQCEQLFSDVEQMTTEESIMQALTDAGIGDSGTDSLYRKLYQHLMIDIVKPSCMYSITSCNDVKQDMLTRLDGKEEMLDFLTANQANWKLEEEKLVFENADLTQQYNSLVEKTTEVTTRE